MENLYDDLTKEISVIMAKCKDSGHGMGHINRVIDLALGFVNEISQKEYVNREKVLLIAALHDVDDKKLFGEESEEKSLNARRILTELGFHGKEFQDEMCSEIKKMSFRSALKGVTPDTLEGEIVSDADKCDAMGASGLLRAYSYTFSDLGSNIEFDWQIKPIINISYEEYGMASTHYTDTFINHYFEKTLHLPKFMLTSAGKKEAEIRNEFDLNFVYNYLQENRAPEEFFEYAKQIEEELIKWER